MINYGMCQNCDEFHRGYCFCNGEPDKIIGEMLACEFYKEKPKGEWKHEIIGDKPCVLCSICNLHFDNESNFCPNCGTDMRGEKDDIKKSS